MSRGMRVLHLIMYGLAGLGPLRTYHVHFQAINQTNCHFVKKLLTIMMYAVSEKKKLGQ